MPAPQPAPPVPSSLPRPYASPVAPKEKVAKKTKSTKSTTKPRNAQKRQTETNPKNLTLDEATKRVDVIYRLEKAVESKRASHAVAKLAAKAAKEALAAAVEALESEIREQRLGPGPLFTPDGKSAANYTTNP